MKDFIISTLDILLEIFVVLAALGGFIVGGFGNLSGDFSIIRALAGGLFSLSMAIIFTGGVFTLIRIKELLEEQMFYLQKADTNRSSASTDTTIRTSSRGASAPIWRDESSSRSSPVRPTSSGLRRCPKCNTIINTGNECSVCGTKL